MKKRMVTKMATLCVAYSGAALAQSEPATLLEGKQATSGNEDVATSGFEKSEAPPAEAQEDQRELRLAAGGMASGGNASALAVTANGKFRYRHLQEQISAAIAANYGRARAAATGSTETVVENLQGKVRYDHFLSERLALFLAVSGLTNRFQGLVFRLNVDPGVAYYFVQQDKQRFWTEFGYDLQFDVRRQDALDAATLAGESLDKSEASHNGRLFLGYDNAISETFAFDAGVEYLQGISDTDNRWLNIDAGFTSSIKSGLSIATTFSLRYDDNPLPGVRKTDYVTALSLVYQLL